MVDLDAERFPDGTRVRIVPVGSDLSRSLVDNRESAAEESLGSVHVASGTQQRVDQIAFPIYGAVKITPLTFYLYVCFIDIPTPANFALAFTPKLLGAAVKKCHCVRGSYFWRFKDQQMEILSAGFERRI